MTDPIKFELLTQIPERSEQVLAPYFQGTEIDNTWIPYGVIEGFSGKHKQVYSVHVQQQQQQQDVFLLGLGKDQQLPLAYQTFRHFAISQKSRITPSLLVDLRHLPESVIYQCVLGLSLSDYTVGVLKTESKEAVSLQQVQLLVSSETTNLDVQIHEAQQTASVIKRISALVDAPGNLKTPQYLAQWALESGKQFGYAVEILDQDALKTQNLSALLAVGRGSEHQPLLIKSTYSYSKSDRIDLGIVGKGVTFDTGGISLKKPANMHYMKSDMAGAAAVMGAMELIARLKLPLNIAAVIPVAENSIDASSIRPGDVIQSHAGKSIEVIDTDAEGRLILADALSYIQEHYNPKVLIDLATLTGSCVAALGYEAAGLFTKDDALADTISQAGEQTSERVWRLPLWDSYREAMDSDIADIKNLSGKPVAGAITAAKFLEYFIKKSQQWAHLDIAGVAFGGTDYTKTKSATGYGVRLLVDFARTLIST